MVSDLYALSAREAVRSATLGEITVEALVHSYLDRIAEIEPGIRAWQYLDVSHALKEARRLDQGRERGALHGLLLAVKDVIATADMPTAYGSRSYLDSRPPYDAAVVATARAANALIFGKTVTTEFAALSPGPTRNPFHADHTPGGSSSGSAAAVAAKMVPVALGTQTAGSIIRPASFCGIVGYKPSFGLIEIAGTKALSTSLDTVGVMARDVRDVAFFTAVVTARPALLVPDTPAAPKVGIFRTEAWERASAETAAAMERAALRLTKCGAAVAEAQAPPGFEDLLSIHDGLFDWGMLQALSYERLIRPEKISPITRLMFDDRQSKASAEYFDRANDRATVLRARLDELFADFDILLTPAAMGEAPSGLEATGDASFNRGWTMLHVPCVTVPAGRGPNDLPVGIQIVGRLRDDARTLAAAAFVEAALRDG